MMCVCLNIIVRDNTRCFANFKISFTHGTIPKYSMLWVKYFSLRFVRKYDYGQVEIRKNRGPHKS